jgi:hypothetical protein
LYKFWLIYSSAFIVTYRKMFRNIYKSFSKCIVPNLMSFGSSTPKYFHSLCRASFIPNKLSLVSLFQPNNSNKALLITCRGFKNKKTKMKTKKCASKRFILTGRGKLKFGHAEKVL